MYIFFLGSCMRSTVPSTKMSKLHKLAHFYKKTFMSHVLQWLHSKSQIPCIYLKKITPCSDQLHTSAIFKEQNYLNSKKFIFQAKNGSYQPYSFFWFSLYWNIKGKICVFFRLCLLAGMFVMSFLSKTHLQKQF